ncbi:MAG: DinB family protein [Bacteroidota bacterium]
MENLFAVTQQNRKNLYQILEATPREQLLQIPHGYRNNIWWNVAHVVVTQQLLVYGLSKMPIRIPGELVTKFRKGTAPDGTCAEEEIKMIKDLLLSTTDEIRKDYENAVFQDFTEYITSAKVKLHSVEDAIAFNLFHEGLHMGTVVSLQKAIGAQG